MEMINELVVLLAQTDPETVEEAAAVIPSTTWHYTVAAAAVGSALGVGWVGAKSAEAVGRNPGAFGPILTIGIIGMALAEAIVFYAIFLAKQ